MKGFSPKWFESSITGGSVAINMNDKVGNFFQTMVGLRQGDPLSPLLFNIVANMLTILIDRGKDVGQLSGVVPHLVDGCLSILQYANDTILFMEHDFEQARNMKFHKSEVYCFGDAQDVLEQYTQLFGCKSGEFPMTYLGIPIHFRKLRNADWRTVEERFDKRLSNWKGKHLSTGGRLTLVNSMLSRLPMYMTYFSYVWEWL